MAKLLCYALAHGKKLGVYFLVLKFKTTLVPAESGGPCRKFKKYL
jgi:hypothetical protein